MGHEMRKKLDRVTQWEVLKAMKDPSSVKVKKSRKPGVRKSIKNNMVEKEIEKDIIFHLDLKGYPVMKSGEQSTYNSNHVKSGMSDLIVFCEQHRVIFMEVKQPSRKKLNNGGLRESQIEFSRLCGNYGVKYCVVYSVEDALREVGHYES